MRKIWAVAWKEIYTTYINRSFVLASILLPTMLATLLGLGLGNTDNIPVRNIPVAIVNLDEAAEDGLNFGQVFVAAFVPNFANPLTDETACEKQPSENNTQAMSLSEIANATLVTDASEARMAVERGEYAAAIIVPADFSQKISYRPSHPTLEVVEIEVYGNTAQSISANVIRILVERLTNQLVTGNIAAASTVESLRERFGAQAIPTILEEDFTASLACAFDPNFSNVNIVRSVSETAGDVDLFTYIASAQGMLFLLVMAMRGATDFIQEEQQGTLQRLFTTPTQRHTILTAKMLGTFINCIVQLILLYAAFSVIGSLLKGHLHSIWGDAYISIGLVVIAASFAAAGLGVLVISFARTVGQATAFSGLLTTFLAALGGAFFPIEGVPVIEWIAKLSPVYWGANAFSKLAVGQSVPALNIAILLISGVVTLIIGLVIFNRRWAD